jgi:site-specific DNA-cytosine methylase
MASLFDGIGGFPLAGLMDGIQTLWTSEIELFPIAVTMERFREYEQYGYFPFGAKPNECKKEKEKTHHA